MWKQIQTISSLDSRQNLNEQKNHDGGKGKGVRAKGQKGKRAKGQEGKRAKGQKPQTMIFPVFLPIDRFWKKIFLGLIFLTYRGPFKALYETKLLPTGVPPTF